MYRFSGDLRGGGGQDAEVAWEEQPEAGGFSGDPLIPA